MLNHFIRSKPILFCLLLILIWMLASGIFAFIYAIIFRVSFTSTGAHNASRAAGILIVLLIINKFGLWEKTGITGGMRSSIILSILLGIYILLGEIIAYFGNFPLNLFTLLKSPGTKIIAATQILVALAEELLFRGLILFFLFSAWEKHKNGKLKSAFISAILFGVPHLIYLFFSVDTQEIKIILLNSLYASVWDFWVAALVLITHSIWPAVFIHFISNASIFIIAQTFPPLPPMNRYLRLVIIEIPIILIVLWKLLDERKLVKN